ncbi:hypothetical protein [Cognataquiflexum rubidum]|uniref:hypothetical protein n=1 Tax=Cognataquiflexum rubidum TaxID=2922273 RepID=UPI001F139FAE|nr:hypothetical protein [Cognataquiflexum rubidum]MCH6236795.1 hypothetical protein [Cognataquiflexum rubidum]
MVKFSMPVLAESNFPITHQISQNQTKLISHFFYKHFTPSGLYNNQTTYLQQAGAEQITITTTITITTILHLSAVEEPIHPYVLYDPMW